MKKLLYFLPVFALLFVSCDKKSEYVIEGQVSGDSLNGTKVYLQVNDSLYKEFISLDSTVITDGKFEFKGVTPDTLAIRIVKLEKPIGLYNGAVLVILENGKIEVAMDSIVKVKGTLLNEEYQSFKDKVSKIQDELKPVRAELDTVNDSAKMASLVKVSKEKNEAIVSEFYTFTKKNIPNALGEYLLVGNSSLYDVDNLKELISMSSSNLKNVEIIKRQNESLPLREETKVGASYKDLRAKTPDEKDIALSDYVGKNDYVLIDFWASWCPPCRRDMPNFVAVYEKYKDKGFTIVSISIDDDEAAWKNGIKTLNMTWPQMSELTRPSSLAKAYGVVYIPHTVLLDKEGKVIATGLHGKEVMVMLDQLIK